MWKVTKRKQTVNGKEVGEKITKHNYLGTITVIFQYSNEFSLTVNYKVRIILMRQIIIFWGNTLLPFKLFSRRSGLKNYNHDCKML